MDKTFLLEQLGQKIRDAVILKHKAGAEARQDARSGADRAVNLAKGQTARELQAKAALDELILFRPKPFHAKEPIGLGAVVELEDGESGKTLFIAPVGAGEELTGPDGDGIFQVVTPVSPFGRALLGKRVGDVVEIPIRGEVTEWTITYAA
jgi:transcription elongation GreA/GreB family factor